MSHALITGGAGFIGSHIVETLLERGDDVTILDNLSTGNSQNIEHLASHPKLTVVHGSITDPVLLSEVVRGVDTIYHMAAAVGVKLVAEDPVRTIQTNIYPTEVLLRHALHGKQRFFLASTSEVYGKNSKEKWNEEDDLLFGPTERPRWAYGCSKAIDEFLALAYHRKHGLEVVIGRFFNVVGPRQVGNYGMVIPRFVEQALAGGPVIVYDDGSQERCFGHVSEVVDCVIGLTESDAAVGQIFNIGSDDPVSVKQLAEEIIELTDSSAEIEYRPYEKVYGSDFEDVPRRVPDVSKLARVLGRKPKMSRRELLQQIIDWKRQQLSEEA